MPHFSKNASQRTSTACGICSPIVSRPRTNTRPDWQDIWRIFGRGSAGSERDIFVVLRVEKMHGNYSKFRNPMRENLQSLLNDINDILQKDKVKKEESRKRGERFNMFELLGVAHYEVTHSKIIACFLDPKASHGQGDLFLKLFLNIIDDKSDINTSEAEVFTEYDIKDNGRMDIFIKDSLGNGIIIENKIYAGDQNEQLIRYEKYAKTELTKRVIYYLTLFGDDASENSAGDVAYQQISYAEHIVNWLQSCIQHSATMPVIRETLVQYLNHIKQLTNQDMDTKNKEALLKAMVANPEATAAICNAQEEYKKYVYYTYVRPEFENYAKEKGLIFEDDNLFSGKSGKGFYFRKKDWVSSAIWIYTERSGEWDFLWGISNYNGDYMKVDRVKLDCLNNKPDDEWPYGQGDLKQYAHWNLDAISEMIKGKYVKFIIDLVNKAIEELENKGLPMP